MATVNTGARLACFELWGGNCQADHAVELPGLSGWVYAEPLEEGSGGGDVHYFSACSRGVVSRVAVADVAGHGSRAAAMAENLRTVLQRHTNNWDQSALMQELNDAFALEAAQSQYATAAVLGYYSETGELLFSNAGHPPALLYRAEDQSWNLLQDCTQTAADQIGLPLGLIAGTRYCQTAIRLGNDDLLVLYTDGITEAEDPAGNVLGRRGLLDLARTLPDGSPAEVKQALMAAVGAFRGAQVRRDDETLVVLRRDARFEP